VGIIWLILGAIFMAFSALKIEGSSDELCPITVESCQLFTQKILSAVSENLLVLVKLSD